MKLKNYVLIILVLVIGILFFLWVPKISYCNLETAPSFSASTLEGMDFAFNPVDNRKPTLVVFWASWCKECRYEIPELLHFYQSKKDQVNILGVTVDKNKEKALQLVLQAKMPYPNLLDSQAKVAKLFNVRGTPTLILIDQEGKIRHRGYRLNEKLLGVLSQILDS